MSISIRRVSAGDLSSFICLKDQIFSESMKFDSDIRSNFSNTPQGREYYQRVVSDPNAYVCVIGENEKLIGFAICSEKQAPYWKTKTLEITHIGVLPTKQRQQYASQLLDNISAWAKEHGYGKLFVTSYIANGKALEFYRHHHFHELDVSFEKFLS